SAFFASKLELHTDFAELLPPTHPAVVAYHGLAGRQRSATNLVLLIHSQNAEANFRFAEALRPHLQALVPKTFTQIQWSKDKEMPEFFRQQKWLYAETKDLENAEDLLDRIIARRSQPGFVDLEGDPEEELKKLRGDIDQKLPPAPSTGRKGDYFEGMITPKGGVEEHYIGVMLWQQLGGLATEGAREALAAARKAVADANPKSIDPHISVDYTGGIYQAIEQQDGVKDDLTLATVLVTICVLLALYSYFRRLALLWVIGAPAFLGLLMALFLASVTIHYLNLTTSFLISIILGNGINSPIILLGRYGEERQAGRSVTAALQVAMTGSFTGIAVAVAAASVAYGSLLSTAFRGFNQFGLLGGAGMIFVGLMTFVLVPPLVIFGERRWPGAFTPRRNLWRVLFARLGRLSVSHPLVLALLALIGLGAAMKPLYRYAKDPLEWNMENLRTDDPPSQKFWKPMEQLGMADVGAGFIANKAVLLVDKPEQADAVAEALRKQDEAKGPQLHVLKVVRTIHSVLPDNQAEKLEILARIRKKIDRHQQLMDDKDKAVVNDWRPPDTLRPLTVDDLPKVIRDAFTETDGQRGRLVGIDSDHRTYYDWRGHDLLRLSAALTVNALGKTWVASSVATLFAGMLETIVADGPRVTEVALTGVTLLVLLLFGLPVLIADPSPRGFLRAIGSALPVLVSLAVGVIWLGGIVGVLELKLNFMNFVAVPITLGVGADYAANIWARVRHDGVGKLQAVVADTGSAVALCSLTTIIGYSSLLLSHNRALRSFGKLADLGEILCLVAALVVLPAVVRLVLRTRAARPDGD
ncbi:MAG TPA: MMPL family transporter, partial [Polyangia bacterium]|nr:MMPL family transporter [Polyangia bacterium]